LYSIIFNVIAKNYGFIYTLLKQ